MLRASGAWCGDGVGITVEENTSVFSMSQMCKLPSARACGQLNFVPIECSTSWLVCWLTEIDLYMAVKWLLLSRSQWGTTAKPRSSSGYWHFDILFVLQFNLYTVLSISSLCLQKSSINRFSFCYKCISLFHILPKFGVLISIRLDTFIILGVSAMMWIWKLNPAVSLMDAGQLLQQSGSLCHDDSTINVGTGMLFANTSVVDCCIWLRT